MSRTEPLTALVPDDLLRQLRVKARQQGVALGEIFIEALGILLRAEGHKAVSLETKNALELLPQGVPNGGSRALTSVSVPLAGANAEAGGRDHAD